MKQLFYLFVGLTVLLDLSGCSNKQVNRKDFGINKNIKEVKSEANKAWKELDKQK